MRDPSDVDATLQEADKKYADDVASTLPDCESLEMIPGCDSLEKEVPLLVHCQHPHVMFFFDSPATSWSFYVSFWLLEPNRS